ncbi:hypothetical protein ACIQ2D_15395 [Lysinibacillus sp. NPDC097287]|uniref:hypothetical protein n=1 Tax=Lysinibacillus sp. NPDC097287 TaxID=3364144 RepID=UPI00380CBFAC
MSDSIWLLLVFILVLVMSIGMNYFGIKYTRHSKKMRIWAAIIPLLLSPIIFFGLLSISLLIDEGGFGAAFIAVILTSGFILNALIILLSVFFMPSRS